MNVKVKIDLCSTPKREDHDQMYDAVEYLTNDTDSIYVYQSKSNKNALIAEFTINKARQIDVVDRIGKEFSYHLENYSQCSISFNERPTRKPSKKKRIKFTEKQGQYLSFIYYFSKVNSASPLEKDFQNYFSSNLSTVRRMISNLENKELILRRKKPFQIELCIDRSEIPDLE